jgi:hypothetical protein
MSINSYLVCYSGGCSFLSWKLELWSVQSLLEKRMAFRNLGRYIWYTQRLLSYIDMSGIPVLREICCLANVYTVTTRLRGYCQLHYVYVISQVAGGGFRCCCLSIVAKIHSYKDEGGLELRMYY